LADSSKHGLLLLLAGPAVNADGTYGISETCNLCTQAEQSARGPIQHWNLSNDAQATHLLPSDYGQKGLVEDDQ